MPNSRLRYITIDVNDMHVASQFWTEALHATPANDSSTFRKLIIPDFPVSIFLQLVPEAKTSKTRMHLDIETDDVSAEVKRLVALGAELTSPPEQGFAVMKDPFGNEFCVLPVF
jgi:predicted enzyme related to lactoylglutathione lyase